MGAADGAGLSPNRGAIEYPLERHQIPFDLGDELFRSIRHELYITADFMRTFAALIAGIAVFIGLLLLFRTLAQYVGIESYVEYAETRRSEHRLYTEESDGSYTGFGVATLVICGMVAWSVSLRIETGSWLGNTSSQKEALFTAWLLGCLIYTIACIAAEVGSRQLSPGLARTVLVIGDFPALLMTAWIMDRWYRRRINRMSSSSDPVQ